MRKKRLNTNCVSGYKLWHGKSWKTRHFTR